MNKSKTKTPETRISQLISQRPVSISPVLNFRKKLLKHYIPKNDFIKTNSKSRSLKVRNSQKKSFVSEKLPKSIVSLCTSPHKINLNLENALNLDAFRYNNAKRFKPHLTYYKISHKYSGGGQNLSISPEEKFRMLVKGSHLNN